MRFKSLELTNFRNYESIKMVLDSQMIIFLGENGQGKTNLLEAFSFFSNLRSFRVNQENELIRKNCEYAYLKSSLIEQDDQKPIEVKIYLGFNGKSIIYNHIPIKKSSEFVGKINTVLFSPADLNFFDEAPKVRRRFLDVELIKISPQYLNHLANYQLVLKQRNALLKQDKVDLVALEVLDHQLVDEMVYLRDKRFRFVERLSQKTQKYFNKISSVATEVKLVYKHDGFDEDKVILKEKLLKNIKSQQNRDINFKMTHCGVHRDDLSCLFDNHEILSFASQGQKRLVLIAMKLALIDIILEITKRYPILLLDDVLSELDDIHQRKLLETCPKALQTIVTCTKLDFVDKLKNKPQIFRIKDGQII